MYDEIPSRLGEGDGKHRGETRVSESYLPYTYGGSLNFDTRLDYRPHDKMKKAYSKYVNYEKYKLSMFFFISFLFSNRQVFDRDLT